MKREARVGAASGAVYLERGTVGLVSAHPRGSFELRPRRASGVNASIPAREELGFRARNDGRDRGGKGE